MNQLNVTEERKRCKFILRYYHPIKHEFVEFRCNEPAVKDGYCMFHHEAYCKSHGDEVAKELEEKITKDLQDPSKEVLELIGYIFPDSFDSKKVFNNRIEKPILFIKSKFLGLVSLTNIIFKEIVDFRDVSFIGGADFGGASFIRWANFVGANFSEIANFRGASFGGEANFGGASFIGGADFGGASFGGEANFGGANFSGWADFGGASFIRWANFGGANFSEIANFRGASFIGGADFGGASFGGEANFGGAIFIEEANFGGASFGGEANFGGAIFITSLDLLDVSSFIDFARIRLSVSGRDSNRFNIVFDRITATKVSFIYTDLTRIEFRDVKWFYEGNNLLSYKTFDSLILHLKNDEKFREKYFKHALKRMRELVENENEFNNALETAFRKEVSFFQEKKIRIADGTEKTLYEIIKNRLMRTIKKYENKNSDEWWKDIEKRLKDIGYTTYSTIDNVLSVYRGLRENYDYFLKYEESGKFFVGEMDTLFLKLKEKYRVDARTLKEKVRSINKYLGWTIEWFVLKAYRVLALYGESYLRPIVWSLLIILSFAVIRSIFIMAISGIWPAFTSIDAFSNAFFMFLSRFLIELHYSWLAFFQLVDIKDLQRPDVAIERLLGILVFGLLYISLKRRLERRIRH
ncbi:MAG: pentapeptide repeat-containing protein [Candidatus Asgardarchaeia archaeon]